VSITELHLVRHGHNEDGAELPDGNHDGRLSGLGRQQSARLAERLVAGGARYAEIRHSTLPRAAETAAVLAEQLPGVPVVPDDLLRECIPSRPAADVLTAGQREWFAGWERDLPDALVDGPRQAAAAVAALSAVTDEDRCVLLVTHGNLIRWFAAAALGAPAHAWLSMQDDHAALTVLRYHPDRRPQLVRYNDAGHLESTTHPVG
jgi:serine/threonine-protein phosphatase PGAM5